MFDNSQEIEMQWVARNRKRYQKLGYRYTKLFDTFMVKAYDLPKGSDKYVKVNCDYCGKEYKQQYKHQYNHKGTDCCKSCWNTKMKESMYEKYGVCYALQSKDFIEKYEKTCLDKFGCKKHLSSSVVREKINLAYYNNGTCPTSKPQIVVYNMLKQIYGNCELNKPCGNSLLDCVVEVNGIKIDVEYDGWYWHKDKQEEDKRRNYFLIKNGYKVCRFRANYAIPTIEQIKNAVDYLLSGHSLKIIDLDI